MVKSVSNIVGVNLEEKQEVADGPRHNLGQRVNGDDGHEYIYAQSSGTIAADTVCILTEPALTMAAGAGEWTSVVATVVDEHSWFQLTAI